MRKRRDPRLAPHGAALLMLALVLAIPMIRAQAQVVCPPPANSTLDSDGDGFSDLEECAGIPLLDGTRVSMDPNTKDMFIIVVPASPSRLPGDPAEFISKPQAQGGLGITPHLVSSSQVATSRLVGATQKAVLVTESSDTNGNVAGECPWGTANDPLAQCVVYMAKIEQFVNSVYASVGQAAPADVITRYKKHTFAHESLHGAGRLTLDSDSRFGGHHYKSGSNAIHDQSVIYTLKGTVVRFIIGTSFTTADQGEVTLK